MVDAYEAGGERDEGYPASAGQHQQQVVQEQPANSQASKQQPTHVSANISADWNYQGRQMPGATVIPLHQAHFQALGENPAQHTGFRQPVDDPASHPAAMPHQFQASQALHVGHDLSAGAAAAAAGATPHAAAAWAAAAPQDPYARQAATVAEQRAHAIAAQQFTSLVASAAAAGAMAAIQKCAPSAAAPTVAEGHATFMAAAQAAAMSAAARAVELVPSAAASMMAAHRPHMHAAMPDRGVLQPGMQTMDVAAAAGVQQAVPMNGAAYPTAPFAQTAVPFVRPATPVTEAAPAAAAPTAPSAWPEGEARWTIAENSEAMPPKPLTPYEESLVKNIQMFAWLVRPACGGAGGSCLPARASVVLPTQLLPLWLPFLCFLSGCPSFASSLAAMRCGASRAFSVNALHGDTAAGALPTAPRHAVCSRRV